MIYRARPQPLPPPRLRVLFLNRILVLIPFYHPFYINCINWYITLYNVLFMFFLMLPNSLFY